MEVQRSPRYAPGVRAYGAIDGSYRRAGWVDEAPPGGGALGQIEQATAEMGSPGSGVSGFRRTHQQALGAQVVALAASGSDRPVTSFPEVAPLALMSGSPELMRIWVIDTLGALADDNSHSAVLRDTLRVFLQENGSFVATAERLTLYKNTVRYRVGKAEESLGDPAGGDHLQVELAPARGPVAGLIGPASARFGPALTVPTGEDVPRAPPAAWVW